MIVQALGMPVARLADFEDALKPLDRMLVVVAGREQADESEVQGKAQHNRVLELSKEAACEGAGT